MWCNSRWEWDGALSQGRSTAVRGRVAEIFSRKLSVTNRAFFRGVLNSTMREKRKVATKKCTHILFMTWNNLPEQSKTLPANTAANRCREMATPTTAQSVYIQNMSIKTQGIGRKSAADSWNQNKPSFKMGSIFWYKNASSVNSSVEQKCVPKTPLMKPFGFKKYIQIENSVLQ